MTNQACPTTQKAAQGVPEVALWRAVILILMADLVSRRAEAADAKSWFFENDRDLVTVCGMACLSHEAVKDRAREILEMKRAGHGSGLCGTVAGRTPIKRLQRGHTHRNPRGGIDQ